MPPSHASLVARDVTVTFGDALILDRVALTVSPGSRIGIVAPNGTGKTTFLKVLAGLLRPDAGAVTLAPPEATVGYLPQEPERSVTETVEVLLGRRTGVAAATSAMEHAADDLAAGTPGSDDRYADALERWLALGGPDFEARTDATLADLGLDAAVTGLPTRALSGGQAARVSLAAILLARFDVFLLDEPTNDLDFDGIARLERFVQQLPGGLVVVSHDRAFLDSAVETVLELDEFTRRATEYGGGWQAYLDARTLARRHAWEAHEEYESKRGGLAERQQRQREWAMQGASRAKKKPRDGDKFIRAHNLAQTEKLVAKAAATERAIDRLEVVEEPREAWELRLEIAAAPRSGAVVARLAGAVIERGAFRLGPVDLQIDWAERVAVVGPNGSGKTTLLAALLGRLPLTAGERWLGPGVIVGEMDQARGQFAEGTLLDAFGKASGLLPQECRSLLAKFGLGASDVVRKAATLSPGERTRASLALLMARGVNCLVLDEPTNHLDLPAIEQLEQALDTYDGTLILVTHDRRLLDAVRLDRTIEVGVWI